MRSCKQELKAAAKAAKAGAKKGYGAWAAA